MSTHPRGNIIVSMRIKIEMEGMDGQLTPCQTELEAGSDIYKHLVANCPRLLRKTMYLDSQGKEQHYHKDRWIQPGSIGKYGQWFWFR